MKSAERFGTSDTELATIITSVLIDRKIITKDATSEIVDRNVVRRQRNKCRENDTPLKSNISGLYFDSKIDSTLQSNKKLHPENHLTVLNEPGSEYIGHIAMAGHSVVDLLNGIVDTVPSEELKQVGVTGADGTNTNTGRHGGAIALLEKKLKRKFHWNVSFIF